MTKQYFLFFLTSFITFLANAQPGAPDSSFNGKGYVLISIPGRVNTGFESGVAQPDGKIIAVGGTDEFANNPYNSDALVVRYNADGSPDAGFGTSGTVVTDIEGTNDRFYAVALQQDGRIVAAGRAQSMGGSYSDCAVVRYNADGSLDQTFGNGGKLKITISYLNDELISVAIQPDGKIVLTGTNEGPTNDMLVVRLNPNGSMDSNFGNQGKVFIDFASSLDLGAAMTLQPDGKILVTGDVHGETSGMGLARLNTDGSLDATFGNGGKVIKDIIGSYDDASRAVILMGDRIILGGWAILPAGPTGKYCMVLAAFHTDGSPDVSFGDNNGLDTTDFGISHDFFYEIISRGNKIIGAGTSSQDAVQNSNEDYDLAIAAYNADGSYDTGFGDNGKVHSDFSDASGLVSGDHAKTLFYHNNTLYAVGSSAHFTGEWDYNGYGTIAAYQLEPLTACYVEAIPGLTATPSSLWPPNHKMKEVTLSYTLSGNCPDVTVNVTSNEPAAGEADWEVIDDHHVLLRAERDGNGNARIYTITVSGINASGNIVSASVNVTVPKSSGNSAVLEQNPISAQALHLKIASNPTRTHFTLNIESTQKDPVEIKVYDVSGKVVEVSKGNVPGRSYRFGDLYRPGIYIVEVTQNTQRKNVKVMKIK